MASYNTERNTFRDDDRYSRTLWQQGKFVLSDELNSSNNEEWLHLRNMLRDIVGNLCIDDSLKVEATGPASTSVTIAPGVFYADGLRFEIGEQQTLDLGTSPGTLVQKIAAVIQENDVDVADDAWLQNVSVGAETAIKGTFSITFQSFLATLPDQQQPVNSFDLAIATNPIDVGVEHGTPPTTPIIIDNSTSFFSSNSFTEKFENGHLIDSNGSVYFIASAIHNSPSAGSSPFPGNAKITLELHKKVGQADPVISGAYSLTVKDILYDDGLLYYPIADVQRTIGVDPVQTADITSLRFLIDSEELKKISLDNAYDAGGSGTGRTITVDSDAVLLNGSGDTNVFEVNKISGAGNCVNITNAGSGYDIDGHNSNWYIDKDGNAHFQSVSAVNLQGITIYRETYLGSDGTGAGNRVYDLVNDFIVGNDSLSVYLDGRLQRISVDYVETDKDTVTFLFDVMVAQEVTFDVGRKLGSAFGQIYTETTILGQTVINLPWSYAIGVNAIDVHVNGVLKQLTDDFIETSASVVTFTSARQAGDKVVIREARDALSSPFAHASAHEPGGTDEIKDLDLDTLEVKTLTVTEEIIYNSSKVGDTLTLNDSSNGVTFKVTNSGNGYSVEIDHGNNDDCFVINKGTAGAGECIAISNSGVGQCTYLNQLGEGIALYVDKDALGGQHAIQVDNAGTGNSIRVNQQGNATALVFDTSGVGDSWESLLVGQGFVMASPDGTRYRVTVANGGTFSIVAA